ERLKGDARRAWEEAAAAGIEPCAFAGAPPQGEVLVDALLGTGLDRPLAGDWLAAVEAMNASGRPVVAVDVPTGLHADGGRVLGAAVQATATPTFIGRKFGLYTGAGPDHAGDVVFHDLGVPADIGAGMEPLAWLIDPVWARAMLPLRSRTAHKGCFGHVLVIGGQPGMGGAAQLAGRAALRSGAGLVSLATAPEHAAMISAVRPELMSHGVSGPGELEPLLERATVLALGPGLGQGAWGSALFQAALASGLPLVVDADGLNLLAANPSRREDWVLTPHPGEAARLLGCPVAEVQADRLAAAREIRRRYGGVVVLKGAGSLILGERVFLSATGNPGMASGGMGDVLTGVIAALLAQGLAPGEAAAAGACLHGAAGDRAAGDGERGLLASDLIEALRGVVNG
ncbi:MAG TPA: NAD(P)H-hydrate dehydratase, partial [Gammaproteobacteria bacterium]|nr:NAD(P)H-hydrate dehydratase [Gammaproteobacteria bacterium]